MADGENLQDRRFRKQLMLTLATVLGALAGISLVLWINGYLDDAIALAERIAFDEEGVAPHQSQTD